LNRQLPMIEELPSEEAEKQKNQMRSESGKRCIIDLLFQVAEA
jgi:hypothetical protein